MNRRAFVTRTGLASAGWFVEGITVRGNTPDNVSAQASSRHRLALTGFNKVNLSQGPEAALTVFRVRDPDGTVHLQFIEPGSVRSAGFRTHETGDYSCTIRWIDPTSNRLLREENSIYELDARHTADAHALAAFEKQVLLLRSKLGIHAPLADYALDMARGFREKKRDQWKYWLSLLQHVAEVRPAQFLMLEQIENPWSDFNAQEFLESTGRKLNSIDLSMLGNEYESAAIALMNLSPRDVTVRFKSGVFESEGKNSIRPSEVVEIRSVPSIRKISTGLPAEDVLPKLGEGQTVRLGPGETCKLWLTFHSRKLDSGTYRSKFLVGDLLSMDQPLAIPITLKVYPVRLPDKLVYRQNDWVVLGQIPSEEELERTIAVAESHGVNVFVIQQVSIQVSADGKLGQADTVQHDRLVRHIDPAALLLVSRSVGLKWPAGFKPSQRIRKAVYAQAIHWYVKHMESLGRSIKDWAFYIKDEPGLMGDDATFRKWVEDVREVKALAPEVQVYADPAGGARADMLQRVAGLVDIWQPNLELIREDFEHLAPIFRRGQFWYYEPPAKQRDLDPLSFYRMRAWIAYRFGMTGGGYFIYELNDYWFFDRKMGPEFGTVYPTNHGPVTTKRWEATRDGIEDFELLTMIKKKASDAGGIEGQRVLQLIDEAVHFVTKGQDKVDAISREMHPYIPDYSKWMDYRNRLIQAAIQLNQ